MQGRQARDATSEPTRPRREDLLGLISAKKTKLENALEKNWIAHLLVAGIGVAMVFNVRKVAESVIGGFFKGTYDRETVATILLAIHVYYFMRMGPLLTAFVVAKSWHDEQLECYLTGPPKPARNAKADPLHPLFGTTSFLAAALYPGSRGYLVITTVVVSLAQASALFLVFRSYHVSLRISPASLFFAVLIAAIGMLYWMFWQRAFTRATLILLALALCWFVLFTIVAPVAP
jgi:hypothetical protein